MEPYTFQTAFCFPNERVAVFIDGANFHAATRNVMDHNDLIDENGKFASLDYKILLDYLKEFPIYLLRVYYFTAIRADETGEAPLIKLLDWLAYNGFTVVSKQAKKYENRTKGNMDLEMAVEALQLTKFVDHIVLFTGDGDFLPVVKAIQKQGVRVTAVSTIKGDTPVASDELRKSVDHYVDLNTFIYKIKRD